MITPNRVYESIGVGYAAVCRPDPRIRQLIVDALADANSVLNVGAGAGNYEPKDRRVVAVEPSSAMIAQRDTGAGPAVQGVAEALPFRDGTFDATLATSTLHHWTEIAVGLRGCAGWQTGKWYCCSNSPNPRSFGLLSISPNVCRCRPR